MNGRKRRETKKKSHKKKKTEEEDNVRVCVTDENCDCLLFLQ